MTDRVLILHGDQWLELSTEAYREALKRGNHRQLGTLNTTANIVDDKPLWFTVPQVARLCSVSETHLRDEIALGRIKTRRFGRAVRIHRDFVEHQTSHLDCNVESDK